MYWYLSFLRPPPVSTPSGGSVTITPQIANDLRTELRDEPVDIYYTWQRLPLPLSHSAHSTSASSSHSHPAEMYPTSNPVLLTRWDPPMSTYKPLTLPIPPLAKSGESWRLSLFVQSDTPSTGSISKPGFPTRSGFVPGSDHRLGPSNRAEKLLELGCPVLGVWSEGIRITPSSSSRVAPAEVGSVGSRSTVVGGAGGGSKKAGHTHGPDPGGGRNKKGQYKDDGKGKGKGKGGGGEGESVPKQSRITREFSWTLPLSGSTPSHGATTPSPAPHSSCTHSTLHPHAQRPVPVRQILRIIEQTSFDLDKKIWDSGLALGAWLWRDIVTPSAQSGSERRYGQHDELVQDVLQRCQGRVVELGSGTGLVGIMLYLALRNAGRYGTQDGERGRGEIVATDLPSAIELMQENISLNASDSITDAPSHIAPCPDTPKGENDRSGDSSALADIDLPRSFSEISHIGSTLHARVLDWDEPLPSWISSGLCGSTDGTGGVVESTWPDLVIAADVTYNTASFPSLLQTLISFLKPQHPYTNPDVPSGPNINGTDAANKPKPDIQRPLLLLAYKERDPAERDLWLMLAERGVKMVCVDKVQGAEAKGETEIWVGRHVGDAASA